MISAPDAFFWVGTAGTPETVSDFSTTKILADPKHSYEYTDTKNSKHYILKRSDKKDITLKLPSSMTVCLMIFTFTEFTEEFL